MNRHIFPKGADAVMISSRISRTVRARLMSERGASIFFALLTLLVCITVGSVVLTAGTAASGRLAETAENDQRYYSVSSAAELIKSMVDGQKVTFVKKKVTETTTVTPYRYDKIEKSDPSKTDDPDTDIVTEYSMLYLADGSSEPVPVTNDVREISFCHDRAVDLVFGTGYAKSAVVSETDAEPYKDGLKIDSAVSSDYTLSVTDREALTVHAVCTLRKDGSLVFRLTSADGKHTEYLTFSADVRESEEESLETDEKAPDITVTNETDAIKEFTEKTDVTETWQKTVTVKWTFDGISEDSPV